LEETVPKTEAHIDLTNADAVISSVIRAVYKSLDLDEVFQEIVETLGVYLQADRCFITRFDEHKGILSPPTKEYRSDENIASLLRASPALWTTLAEMALAICDADTPIEFSEIPALSPQVQAELGNISVQSGLACIIRFQNRCQAVLFIHQVREQRNWTAMEKKIVQLVATQSAIAIHHAEQYQAVQTQAKRREIIGQLSLTAIRVVEIEAFFDQALDTVCEAMDLQFAKIIEKTSDPETPYRFRAVRGLNPNLIDQFFNTSEEPQANLTLECMTPIAVDNIERETRFQPSPLHFEYGFTSGVTAVIHGNQRPFGVLQVDSKEERKFSEQDVYLIQSVANIIGLLMERQEAEEALRKSEERLSLVLDATQDALWDWDFKHDKVWWNERYTEILRSFNRLLQYIHPDDQSMIQRTVTVHIEQGDKFECEFRFLRPSGEVRYIWAKGKAVLNQQGNIERLAGTLTDITARKRAENALNAYKRKLEQSNRELEQFAAVASHDLKAPLRKICMFSDALQQVDGAKLSPEGQDYLNRINKASEKMQALITDLLTISSITRKGKPFQPVHLKNVLMEVLANLEPRRKEVNGTIEFNDMCLVEGDESQLSQLFQNLIDNSLKFHRQEAPPVVQVEAKYIANNAHCMIKIQDNGIGMKVENSPKIFEVFERLPASTSYEGTGIGLAVVKKIVERHNGTIQLESTPGQGSIFTITLPMKQE
jgi:PAS domain S-box-containing protein